MIIDPRIPEPVQPIIEDYLSLMEQRLIGLTSAFYVVGSIALHEFDKHVSDIDFIAVLNRRATSAFS